MSDNSDIEWTDATWNPTRGCIKITPGCDHCYAATFAHRFEGVSGNAYELGFEPRTADHKLSEPLRWTQQRTVFVNSMSDLFEKSFTDEYISKVWSVMEMADWHVYQVLTKRDSRMRRFLKARYPLTQTRDGETIAGPKPPAHIWCGVSVEDRKHGLRRVEHLRWAPAAVRFLSVEPLLEDLGKIDLDGIDWVIVGGESGPGARPMAVAWVDGVYDQCREAGVPFFFKQWGGARKKAAGRRYQDTTWDDMPPIVRARYPGRAVAKLRRESLGL